MDEFWQQIARDLIATRHLAVPSDPEALGKWIGRATAVMAEALRVSGDYSGVDMIIGVLGGPGA